VDVGAAWAIEFAAKMMTMDINATDVRAKADATLAKNRALG